MLRIAWSELYAHPLPEGHRFPMEKYDLIPQQLLHEGTITADQLFQPEPVSEEDILLTHTAKYWDDLKNLKLSAREMRKIGFPPSERLILRERVITQGTIDCAKIALDAGVAMNSSGGTHHAFADAGEGFCLLNDIAVAANVILRDKLAKKVLIIDLDVHQGNGTAAIFKGREDVFTLSTHCQANYPMVKESSSRDVALPLGMQDEAFLEMLEIELALSLEAARPDFVFYLSGVDVLATDKLGKLSLSREACKERDRLVFESCRRNGLPVAVSMGGGYSAEIKDIVEAHCNTFRLASQLFF